MSKRGYFSRLPGVIWVFASQLIFWCKTRKFGGPARAFFSMLCIVRVAPDILTKDGTHIDYDKLKHLDETKLEQFEELWALSQYLAEDIRSSAIGLFLTIVGILVELAGSLL